MAPPLPTSNIDKMTEKEVPRVTTMRMQVPARKVKMISLRSMKMAKPRTTRSTKGRMKTKAALPALQAASTT